MAKPKPEPETQADTELPRQSPAERYGVRSVWAHLAMCAATAVLMTLAFPLPGWSFMAWFALVPVGVLAMRTQKLWTLTWTSYLVFFVWWTLRVMWLRHVQSAAPFAMASVCALYFTVALVMLAAVQRRYRGAMTLTLPIFWCTQEILRSVFPVGGFAWFTLASSQAAWRPGQHPGLIVQTADLFGWPTVSFLVAMTSGLMIDLIARPLSKRKANGSVRPRRTIISAMLIWIGCMLTAMLYGQQRLANAPVAGDEGTRSVTLGIVQTNVPQSNKMEGDADDLLARQQQDFERLLELSVDSAADDPRPDLILWPETMVLRPVNDEIKNPDNPFFDKYPPWYHSYVMGFRTAIQEHVDRHRIPVLVGNSAQGVSDQHERSMNSALLVEPGSDSWPRYSKMHLVPMGEYIPGPALVKDLFLKYLSPYGPGQDYTVEPGEDVVVFDLKTRGSDEPVRFTAPICYEDAVAMQCRKMVYDDTGQKQSDLLLNLTNDGWYPGSHQGHQHLQIAVLRSIENRVPMARSVNTGVSGLIDSSGRVGPLVTEGGKVQEVDGHVNVVVALDPRLSLYGSVRESVWIGICAAAGLLLLGVFVPSRKKQAIGR